MTKTRVFADTNVIIEAFRLKIWSALCDRFQVETVEMCVVEALSGDHARRDYLAIDPDALKKGLAQVHTVSNQMRAQLVLYPNLPALDAGERDLLAFLLHENFAAPTWNITTADKAAVKALFILGWLDHSVCVETLAKQLGVSSKIVSEIAIAHSEKWLSRCRTDLLLNR